MGKAKLMPRVCPEATLLSERNVQWGSWKSWGSTLSREITILEPGSLCDNFTFKLDWKHESQVSALAVKPQQISTGKARFD